MIGLMGVNEGTTREVRKEVVRRLLSSPQFAQAESLRRIVNLLFERTEVGDTGSIREQQIAIEALRRPNNFDPKIDPIVRVSIANIRNRLRNYFEREGRKEAVHVSIPKGQYRLQFETPPDNEARPAATSVEQFWNPYLSPANPNILMFAEVLFFRDEDGTYIRNIYVNDRSNGVAEIQKKAKLSGDRPLRPSFHFVSAGEMASLLSISQVFCQLGATLEYRNARFFNWTDARHANIILLGSSRTNLFVRSLQGDLPLTIAASSIQVSNPRSGEQSEYSGQSYADGDLERLVEYALITRRPGPLQGTVLTMISANHGRAIEGAGRFLTEEAHLCGLEEALEGKGLHGSFQVIVRVEMLDYDEEVVDVRYVTHRILPDRSELASG